MTTPPKMFGYQGTVTFNATDYGCTDFSLKLDQEKCEYVPMGSDGSRVQVPGGVHGCSGSFTFVADATLLGDGTGGPGPYNNTALVPIVATYGASGSTHSFTFSAAVYDLSIKKNSKGLLEVSGSYESSGTITWA